MSGAQVFARKVRRLVLNRQGTEAQIFLLTPGGRVSSTCARMASPTLPRV